MATKTLVIDGTSLDHFFLAVQAGTLCVGDNPAHPEGAIQNLRVVRVRCEVDIDEERDRLPVEQAGVISAPVLRPGADVRLAHASLSLRTPEVSAPTPDPAPADAPVSGTRRLKVTDGADQGAWFVLPESGTVTVGKAAHAGIGLNDLYVARVHCTLSADGGAVTVTPAEGASGTLIDGVRISGPQVLRPRSVLRVGNSHLRLEVGPVSDEPAPAPVVKKDGTDLLRGLGVDGARAPGSAEPGAAEPFTELTGQTVGHFHLDRLLGRGRAGAVFLATNTKSGHPAAVRVLPPEFPAAPAELERFTHELRAIQPVRHPNLVGLLGAGKTATHCWIAREFVAGESAADVVARLAEGEKPSWTRAARVVAHLMRALDHLHQHRLVHGNITPRTVLLQTGDHATKLADLRLAELLAGSVLQKKLTEKDALADLPYRAPEQLEAGGFVDRLADLYAVGAVAYALCTGRRPVTGHTVAEVRDRVLAGHVGKPSAVYKKVPPAFDAVVLKLMARHQEDRYQTAAAVVADLAPIAAAHDLKL